MLQLITNKDKSASHQHKLVELLDSAIEVCISVAFLKRSGLDVLTPYFKKAIKFKILAGANFGITDPDALTLLLSHAEQSNRVSAYLNKLNSKQVFHPKIYLIKDHLYCHILIGSANLTNGGLHTNNECSLYHRCSEKEPVWLETIAYFNDCISTERADILSERIISIYRKYQKKQKAINALSEEFPDVSANLIYDLQKLKSHYEKLNKAEILRDFREKEKYYLKAKDVLDVILNQTHKPKEFKNLVEDLVGKKDTPGLWYSNGMFRHKGSIFKQQALFKKLIKTIKDNLDKSPQLIFDTAKKVTKDISGVGPNFIGEIMMTYAPKKLANINRNPITVLKKEGGADIKSHSQSFDGKDYEEYNAIIKEITEKLGLKNMLEADYFFNSIYTRRLNKIIMSRVHYFQRYDSKENWITNSTLLLLSRLYNYNRLKFQTAINEILAESNLSLDIGVNFSQQQWSSSSVVDGVISQDSFKIVIETKLSDNFDAGQLKNHLSALTSTSGKKILLALSKGVVSLSVRKELIKELQKEEYNEIQFASTTYSSIIKIIQETLADYEVEMKEILDDYILICKEHHLTDIENHTMLAVTATTSIVINRKYNIYYDPATRNHNIPFKYLALYLDKTITDIGQLSKVVYCDYENGTLVSTNDNPLVLTPGEAERIKKTIVETTYYDLRKGVKFFLVDQFVPADFKKVSFSSLRAKKYFFLNEYSGYKDSMNSVQIAQLLNENTW